MTGNDYRVLVIGGRMVAVAQRVPAHVVGDGTRTVAELVELTNQDPRRGIGHEKVLTRIKVDDDAVALVKKQGFAMDDVPPKDAMVLLAATGNMSTGGISIDRTWEAHEENVEIAEEAARVVGLDVAGIDFLTPDITQPVRETGGAIVEVNAAPGFRMHTNPTEGEPQYVAKEVVDLLFPPGTPSRIPIVAVTGSNGKTTTVRMIAHIFKGMGRSVGFTTTDGVYIDERLVKRADASGPRSAQMVLQNPRVDFAVFETARGGILREGLGYGKNDVAVVMNVTGDHLGLKGIDTLEQLAAVKQVIVEAVPKTGWAVLNADDPLVLEMRRACSGSVILFSMQERHELIDRWVRRGRKAVVLEKGPLGEMMVIREGRRTMPIAWVHALPATFEGRARMMVQNAMAAAAAAHAAGAHLHDIRQGLRSFTTSIYQAPGRLNVFDLDGVKILIDYAHNAAGLEMLGDFVERLTHDAPHAAGRPGGGSWIANLRVAVVATAGDRRDEDMRELGRVAARHFDDVIIREDRNPRGRPPGETAALIEEGVREAMGGGARAGNVEVALDEMDGDPAGDRPVPPRRPRGAVRRLRDRGVQGARAPPPAGGADRAGGRRRRSPGEAGGDPDVLEAADDRRRRPGGRRRRSGRRSRPSARSSGPSSARSPRPRATRWRPCRSASGSARARRRRWSGSRRSRPRRAWTRSCATSSARSRRSTRGATARATGAARRSRRSGSRRSRGPCGASGARRRNEDRRLVARSPLDAAAHARPLVRRRRAAVEHGVDRGAQVLAGHRDPVARPAAVELPAVGEPAPGVVEEEVGRARGAERPGHLLRLVEQVREPVARQPGLLGEALGGVLRVRGRVVRADRDHREVRVRVVVRQPRDAVADVLDVGAVAAEEHHQQSPGAGEVGGRDPGSGSHVGQRELVDGASERRHRRGDRHVRSFLRGKGVCSGRGYVVRDDRTSPTRRRTRPGDRAVAPRSRSQAKISGRIPSAVTATTSPRRARSSVPRSAESSSA